MTVAAGTAGAVAQRTYLRKEGALSIVINAVLSVAFFLAGFGFDPAVPVRIAGMGGYALDFLPQSFMIALMSALVPGAITAARMRNGRIGGAPETTRALVVRSLLTALVALVAGGAIAMLLRLIAGAALLPWSAALFVKIVYGAALAAAVTPFGLRQALRQAVFS